MRNRKSVLNIAYTAVFAAIIMLATQIKISTGMGEGYIHIGDSMIYLAACALPLPYGLLAAALGGACADLLAGYAVWTIPTAVIKALTALPFALASKKSNKLLNKKTAFMTIPSGIVTVVGYFIAESILYSVESATLSILGSFIQAVGGAIIYYLCAAALDKLNFKRRVNNG